MTQTKEKFRNPNFFKLIAGRVLTNVGDSIFLILLPIILYKAVNSTDLLLILNFVIIGMTMLSALFGPLLNKMDKKRWLVISQIVQIIFVAAALILLNGKISFGLSIVVISFVGCFQLFNFFSYTLQQAFVPELVHEKDLMKANKYMQIAYTTVNIASDALAPVIIVTLSILGVLGIDAVLYAASIVMFLLIKRKNQNVNVEVTEVTENAEEIEEPQEKLPVFLRIKRYFIAFAASISELSKNKLVRSIMVVSFVSQISFQLLITYISAYFVDNNADFLYPLYSLALFIGMLGGNFLSEYIGKFKNVAIVAFVSGVFWVAYPIFSAVPALSLIGFFLLGCVTGLIDPIFMTYMQKMLKESFGSGLTTMMSINSAGKLLALPITYLMFSFFGYSGIFIMFGILMGLMAVIFLFSQKSEQSLLSVNETAEEE